tara:strand:+ start:42161 stop:43300 length:1140 start_codon:yes stop_codon:yes gene_type:complete
MKTSFRLNNLLALALIITTFGCNKDDDDTPITLQGLEVAIDENPTIAQVLGTVQSDSDSPLTYSIDSQTPSGALNIDASSGELTVADATIFDFETNVVISATVSAEGAVNTAAVTININNVIETEIQGFTATIDENPTSGISLGTVQATGDGTLSYSINSQTPTGALNIDQTTGEITVADAALFDFETNPTITATISVDNSGAIETSSATIDLNDLHEVGEFKFGGVIFWVNASNNEGYAVSMENQSASASYGCMHTSTGATGIEIGTGQANTNAILAICSASGTAADLCSNLNSNGFDDWFLPSQGEIREIMDNKTLINITLTNNGGTAFSIANANYWTSTEVNAAEARIYNFNNDWFPSDFKSLGRPVRAVRAWTDF